MTQAKKWTVIGMITVASMLAVPTSRAGATDSGNVEGKIASAKTVADHEALATYYDQQAAEARTKADEHRKMGAAYKAFGGFALKAELPRHCDSFANKFQADAKMYQQMAAAHRAMAKKSPR